jgi:uncharacterized protein YrrD
MRLADAEGRPVISRDSAERVGELRHVVVDPASRRIVALHVAGRGRRAAFVCWEDVVGFGDDAVVVAGEGAARPPSDDRERAVAGGDLDLEGRLVLDDRGDAAGRLADVVFDESTGALTALLVGDAEIAAERLRAIGPYCVIVRAEPPGTGSGGPA